MHNMKVSIFVFAQGIFLGDSGCSNSLIENSMHIDPLILQVETNIVTTFFLLLSLFIFPHLRNIFLLYLDVFHKSIILELYPSLLHPHHATLDCS